MFNEIIYLAEETESGALDEYGDPTVVLIKKKLWAESLSIGMKEFYQAETANGFKPEIKFKIPDYSDYSGEPYLIHDDIRYKILRTYKTDTNELEITCYGGVRDVSTPVSNEGN